VKLLTITAIVFFPVPLLNLAFAILALAMTWRRGGWEIVSLTALFLALLVDAFVVVGIFHLHS
jgi:hypothetical protein